MHRLDYVEYTQVPLNQSLALQKEPVFLAELERSTAANPEQGHSCADKFVLPVEFQIISTFILWFKLDILRRLTLEIQSADEFGLNELVVDENEQSAEHTAKQREDTTYTREHIQNVPDRLLVLHHLVRQEEVVAPQNLHIPLRYFIKNVLLAAIPAG